MWKNIYFIRHPDAPKDTETGERIVSRAGFNQLDEIHSHLTRVLQRKDFKHADKNLSVTGNNLEVDNSLEIIYSPSQRVQPLKDVVYDVSKFIFGNENITVTESNFADELQVVQIDNGSFSSTQEERQN